MCLSTTLKNYALRENLYKIESFDQNSAEKIAQNIREERGRCEVLGSAVVTNHVFTNNKCNHLVAKVKCYERLTRFDIECFLHI